MQEALGDRCPREMVATADPRASRGLAGTEFGLRPRQPRHPRQGVPCRFLASDGRRSCESKLTGKVHERHADVGDHLAAYDAWWPANAHPPPIELRRISRATVAFRISIATIRPSHRRSIACELPRGTSPAGGRREPSRGRPLVSHAFGDWTPSVAGVLPATEGDGRARTRDLEPGGEPGIGWLGAYRWGRGTHQDGGWASERDSELHPRSALVVRETSASLDAPTK